MKRITICLILVTLISLLALTACSLRLPDFVTNIFGRNPDATTPVSEAETLKVYTDASLPPFESLDPQSGEIVGFDIDLMNAIAEKAGFEVMIENLSWRQLVEKMNGCQEDIYISAMPVRQVSTEVKTVCHQVYLSTSFNQMELLFDSCAEKTNPLTFTQSYYQDKGIVMLVNANDNDIISQVDLKGKMVAALIGTTADEFLQGVQAEPLLFDDPDLAVQVLLDKKVDAFLIDYRTALGYLADNQGLLKISDTPLTEIAYAIGVCEYGTNSVLLEKINKALDVLRADGTLAELEEKWLVVK